MTFVLYDVNLYGVRFSSLVLSFSYSPLLVALFIYYNLAWVLVYAGPLVRGLMLVYMSNGVEEA